MRTRFTDIIGYMLSPGNSNFFAHVLCQMPSEETSIIPFMGVVLKDRRYVLLYNAKWLEEASLPEVKALIEHEVHHVILEHTPRFIRFMASMVDRGEETMAMLAKPYSQDLAVNSIMNEFSKSFMKDTERIAGPLPGNAPFENYPKGQSVEWYTHKIMHDLPKHDDLMKQLQQMLKDAAKRDNASDEYRKGFSDGWEEGKKEKSEDEKSGGGGGTEKDDEKKDEGSGGGGPSGGQGKEQDDYDQGHEDGKNASKNASGSSIGDIGAGLLGNHLRLQEEISSMNVDDAVAVADELEQKARLLVRSAIEAHKKSRGTIPGNMQEAIDKLFEEPRVKWTKILRNKVINTQRYKKTRSLHRAKRRNIAMPRLLKFPGKGKDKVFTVAFLVDTSGSMGADELQLAMNELQGLQKVDRDIKITIVEADTCIGREYEVGAHDVINPKFTGRGGTDFNAAMLRAQELKPDICFYFTDGYAPAPRVASRLSCPFGWVITPGGVIPDRDYGFILTT